MRQFAMALCRRIGMLLRGGAQLGGTPDELDELFMSAVTL